MGKAFLFVKFGVNTVCPSSILLFSLHRCVSFFFLKKRLKTKLQTDTGGGDIFFISQKSSMRQSRETERGKQHVEMTWGFVCVCVLKWGGLFSALRKSSSAEELGNGRGAAGYLLLCPFLSKLGRWGQIWNSAEALYPVFPFVNHNDQSILLNAVEWKKLTQSKGLVSSPRSRLFLKAMQLSCF